MLASDIIRGVTTDTACALPSTTRPRRYPRLLVPRAACHVVPPPTAHPHSRPSARTHIAYATPPRVARIAASVV